MEVPGTLLPGEHLPAETTNHQGQTFVPTKPQAPRKVVTRGGWGQPRGPAEPPQEPS